mmetsp:Transcript_33454/g.66583  ORF Transcript_33454/g.66583 Transcript_33454/m.66583 type:complete len:285 (+) Transcript_33454:445-1299(+)
MVHELLNGTGVLVPGAEIQHARGRVGSDGIGETHLCLPRRLAERRTRLNSRINRRLSIRCVFRWLRGGWPAEGRATVRIVPGAAEQGIVVDGAVVVRPDSYARVGVARQLPRIFIASDIGVGREAEEQAAISDVAVDFEERPNRAAGCCAVDVLFSLHREGGGVATVGVGVRAGDGGGGGQAGDRGRVWPQGTDTSYSLDADRRVLVGGVQTRTRREGSRGDGRNVWLDGGVRQPACKCLEKQHRRQGVGAVVVEGAITRELCVLADNASMLLLWALIEEIVPR